MRLILRFRFLHLAGLGFFALQLADAPAIVADAMTPKLRICPHTKAQYKRGNPCPCGHKHGKNRDLPRFVSEHGDCENDADSERLRAPGFEAFVFTYDSEYLLSRELVAIVHPSVLFLPSGLTVDPPDTPS